MRRPVAIPSRSRVMGGLLAALSVLIVLTSCTGGSAPSPSDNSAATAPQATPRTQVIGATAEPDSLDPTASDAAAGSQALLYNVYETLVKLDAAGNLRPLLAQAWDVTADRRTYTFRLQPQARFADGTPVTAEAVVANIERIRTATVAPKLKRAMAVVSSTQVVNPTTVQVTLERPSVTWLYEMASTAGIVANPAGFDRLGTASAGSGPLAVGTWMPGDSIVLVRNTEYWGTPVRFDEVTFRYFRDPNAMTAAMLSGQLDIISNLQAPEALGQFSDRTRFTVIEGGTHGEVVLGINNGHSPTDPEVPAGHGNPALADLRVRQAIAMAIDKRALVDTVWSGMGTVLGSMSVPGDPYYEDLSGVNAYNPERARELLAEAGQRQLKLRLRPAALPYATKSAQFIASQLGAVGITVEVEELQFPGTWVQKVLTEADYDLTIVAHVEPRDLSTFANPNYYWRYQNPAFNEAIAAADTGTVEEYAQGMKQASRLLAEDAAAVWLFNLPNLVVTKAGITGIPENASASLSFDVTTIASG